MGTISKTVLQHRRVVIQSSAWESSLGGQRHLLLIQEERGSGGCGHKAGFKFSSRNCRNSLLVSAFSKMYWQDLLLRVIGKDGEGVWEKSGIWNIPIGKWHRAVTECTQKGLHHVECLVETETIHFWWPESCCLCKWSSRAQQPRGRYPVSRYTEWLGFKVLPGRYGGRTKSEWGYWQKYGPEG